MKKGNFTQSVTRFKNKSKNIQPVIIETDLVDSLIGDEKDKAPSIAAVNEGLDGKVNAQLFSTGKNKIYCARPNNPNSYYDMDSKPWLDCIPVYTNVESNIVPNASVYGQATIVVVDPKHPFQSANKHYVDEEIAKMEVLLGALIKSVEVEGYQAGWTVPEGALSSFYFPSTEVEYTTGDYDTPETAMTHINTLYFYDENFSLLGSEAAISDMYYEIPSGTTHIGNDFNDIMGELDPPFNYMAATPCRLTFMIKVGV